ncbi:hypothetical protein ACWPKS_10405 [Coraliomargarita sp. W4R72]
MSYNYGSATRREQNTLGFRQDEDARSTLEEVDHAISVLKEAVDRTHDEDVRDDETSAALDFLKSHSDAKLRLILTEFRKSLDIENAQMRQYSARKLLKSYCIQIARNMTQ